MSCTNNSEFIQAYDVDNRCEDFNYQLVFHFKIIKPIDELSKKLLRKRKEKIQKIPIILNDQMSFIVTLLSFLMICPLYMRLFFCSKMCYSLCMIHGMHFLFF